MSEEARPDRAADVEPRDVSAYLTRRQSLRRIAGFAAATAPAMVVLLPGSGAEACKDGDGDNGNHYGWEKGNRHSRF